MLYSGERKLASMGLRRCVHSGERPAVHGRAAIVAIEPKQVFDSTRHNSVRLSLQSQFALAPSGYPRTACTDSSETGGRHRVGPRSTRCAMWVPCSQSPDPLKNILFGTRDFFSVFPVFFAGHGGSVADKSGDEADNKDETVVPVDYKSAGQITDDEILKEVGNAS